jgi:hypothetical protein
MTNHSYSDCRNNDGVTIGIIDSFITLSRLFRGRVVVGQNVREALKDLAGDEDFAYLCETLETIKNNP